MSIIGFLAVLSLCAFFLTATISILQIAHLPGLSDISFGCIGQLYFVADMAVFFAVLSFLVWANMVVAETMTSISTKIDFFMLICLLSVNDITKVNSLFWLPVVEFWQ
jgi:hypothetical protein